MRMHHSGGAGGIADLPLPIITTQNKSGQRTVFSIVLLGYGSHDKIKVMQYPLPEYPVKDQVEVKTVAFGVNFYDVYLRLGIIRAKTLPCVLGIECSGEVVAVGQDVKELQVGDRVACFQYHGDLYRERVILPEGNCFRLPDAVSYEDAAALITNYLTAYIGLFDIGCLKPGYNVLVHSAAGGVGTAAIQLAKTVPQVTMFGTLSSKKQEAVKKLGLHHVLSHEDYHIELPKLCPKGVDIVLDSKAGKHLQTGLSVLKPLGKLIVIGANSAVETYEPRRFFQIIPSFFSGSRITPVELVTGNKCVAGLHLGLLLEKDSERVNDIVDELFRMMEEEKIKPQIDSIFGFEEAVEALKRLENRHNTGKILLVVSRNFLAKKYL